ncbi:MAG: glycosyltransferase family 2 protein, partial [Bryobacteraceae bacterium]
MASVGAAIVTWNSAPEIGRCLDALLAQGIREITVVDNASEDATCELVRRRNVRLIANPWNRGFAAAVN